MEKNKNINPVKLFTDIFFGIIAGIILAFLSLVGGLAGGGTTMIFHLFLGDPFLASLIGGTVAAIAFHAGLKAYDRFQASMRSKDSADTAETRSLTKGGKYLWGSLAYFLATVAGTYLSFAFAPTEWIGLAVIVTSGLLGLAFVYLVVRLKIWPLDLTKPNRH